MKKTIVILAAASALVAGMAACKKQEMPAPKPAITQTVEVSLQANEAYEFTLPKNLRNDEYEITTQAGHASISEVGLNSSGEQVYSYTPQSNFSGEDVVVVSNDEEREHHCGPKPKGPKHKGPKPPRPPKGEEEDHYIITFKIKVAEASATTK